MDKLTDEQEKLIESYYKKIINKKDLRIEMKEREHHREVIVKLLSPNKIKTMSELEFGEIISNLWASSMWANKDYLVKRTISDNGIDNIRKQFDNLLYGDRPFDARYNSFIKEIKGIGPASLTEILCLYNPKEYCIWNKKAKIALELLMFDKLPLTKYQITGNEYQKINKAMSLIVDALNKIWFRDANLLTVDYFLYEVWETRREVPIKVEKPSEFDHNEVRDYIEEIGAQLGFETNTEKKIVTGAKVDVIWSAKIANLGMVTYVFEVHNKGSIDSLILNLQKALYNPTVQRIIAVSTKELIDKIKAEVKTLPENFRKSLTFWEVTDAINTHERLSEVIKSINRLELVKSQFED